MRRVLIVEDEELLADTLREVLVDEGYDAVTAINGQEALRRMAEQRPDLVLLDLMMPEMDGHAFLDAKAKDAELRGIPVLVTSCAPRSVLQSPDAVAGFLAKPFRLKRLLEVLSAMLGKGRAAE